MVLWFISTLLLSAQPKQFHFHNLVLLNYVVVLWQTWDAWIEMQMWFLFLNNISSPVSS